MVMLRMTVFLILVFPILVLFSLLTPDSQATYRKICVVFGFLIGVLYSFIDLMFFSAYNISSYSFFSNFMHAFLHESLIPIGVNVFFLLACTKKLSLKWYNLYYLLVGFFIVRFPAKVINENLTYDEYILFLKPLVYLCMVWGIKKAIEFLYDYKNFFDSSYSKRVYQVIGAMLILFLILSVLLPSVIEVVYILGIPMWIQIFVVISYCCIIIIATITANKVLRKVK